MTTQPHDVHFPDLNAHGHPLLQMERVRPGRFRLSRPFRYLDAQLGVITVTEHESDLTSTSIYNSWITPKLGPQTPAALVHDAMIGDRAYVVEADPTVHIDRDKADAIFHDAMQNLGVPAFRRVVMWAAARLATAREQMPVRANLWIVLMLALCGVLFVDVVDLAAPMPWPEAWSFPAEWAFSVVVVTVAGSVLAIPLGKFWKPVTMQGFTFAIAFVPVLPMIPVWILMVALGPLLSWILKP